MIVEKKTFEPLAEFKAGDNAVEVLKKITERIEYLVKRDSTVPEHIQAEMAADLKKVQDKQTEHEEAIKAGSRNLNHDFTPMLSLLHAKSIVPDDLRSSVEYYNLACMSPEELRFGASYRTLQDSPLQRTAREVGSVEDDAIREFKLVNDRLYFADLLMYANGKTNYARSSSNPVERMKTLSIWKDWERVRKPFERALSTSSVSSWIPTQLSSRLLDLIQPQLQVAALFEQIDMPNKTYDYPLLGADPVCFRIPEGTSIQTSPGGTLSEVSTSKVTFTAQKLAGRSIASTEVLEDEAIGLEAVILRKLAASISRGIEDTTINGDILILSGGTGAQDVDLQAIANPQFFTDRRGAWDGLRKYSLAAGLPNGVTKVDLSSAFTVPGLLSIRALMKGGAGGNMFGLTASDLVFIVNLTGYIKLLTLAESSQASAVLTKEKYGDAATIFTGEVAQIAGSRCILSEFVRDDVSATGLNAASGNTKSTLQLVHRGGFAVGRRRDITVQRSSEHRFDTDEIEYTGTWRGQFRDLYPTASAANRSVGLGFNF